MMRWGGFAQLGVGWDVDESEEVVGWSGVGMVAGEGLFRSKRGWGEWGCLVEVCCACMGGVRSAQGVLG